MGTSGDVTSRHLESVARGFPLPTSERKRPSPKRSIRGWHRGDNGPRSVTECPQGVTERPGCPPSPSGYGVSSVPVVPMVIWGALRPREDMGCPPSPWSPWGHGVPSIPVMIWGVLHPCGPWQCHRDPISPIPLSPILTAGATVTPLTPHLPPQLPWRCHRDPTGATKKASAESSSAATFRRHPKDCGWHPGVSTSSMANLPSPARPPPVPPAMSPSNCTAPALLIPCWPYRWRYPTAADPAPLAPVWLKQWGS